MIRTAHHQSTFYNSPFTVNLQSAVHYGKQKTVNGKHMVNRKLPTVNGAGGF